MSTRKKSIMDASVLAVLGNDDGAGSSNPRDATTATILQGMGPSPVLEGETGLRRVVLKAIEATGGDGNFPQLTRQKTALYRYTKGKSYRSAWVTTLSERRRVHSDVATYTWRKRKLSRLKLVDDGDFGASNETSRGSLLREMLEATGDAWTLTLPTKPGRLELRVASAELRLVDTAASSGCRSLFTLSVDLDAKTSVLEAFYMGLDRSCRHTLTPDAAMRMVHGLNMDLGLESCSVCDCSFGRHGTVRGVSLHTALPLLRGYCYYAARGFLPGRGRAEDVRQERAKLVAWRAVTLRDVGVRPEEIVAALAQRAGRRTVKPAQRRG